MRLSINNRYKLLQGLFWMFFCIATGFVSMYLQDRGITTAGIGLVMATSGALAAFLQPILGRICDRSSRITWKNMILILALPFLILCIVMPFVPGKWAGAVSMGLLMLLANTIMPFINSAHFYYTRAGEYINFGVARAIGSTLYALLALLIGVLAKRFGPQVLPICGMFIAFLFIITTSRMPSTDDVAKEEKEDNSKQESKLKTEPKSVSKPSPKPKGFLLRYPAFLIMLLASLMMITSHNITTTYLLQIIQSLGGDSSQLGIALAIQAIVEVPVLFSFSKLLRRFRPKILMVIASIGYAIKALAYAVSINIPMLYLTQLTQMFSFAIFVLASVYYTAESVTREEQTTGQSYMGSMMAAGMVLGSLIGGWLQQYTQISIMLIVNVVISFIGVGFAVASARHSRESF